jgi:dUTP pyrophosphatase
MQMFFIPVLRAQFRVVDAFEETTARGEGGFGHTGT